jgi:hypothetical protein
MVFETITQFKKMLLNLDGCMNKAAAYADHKKFDISVLAQSRLAPDMFPFIEQVQSVCDVAKFCAAYLSEQKPPKHEDNETTWPELHARIKKAVTYLETMKPKDFEKAATVKVSPGWAEGKWLMGMEYLDQLAIPNFYFHYTTAYAILRNAGVDVGKTDYLGHLNLQK